MTKMTMSVAERADKIRELGLQDLGRRALSKRLNWSIHEARMALEYLRKAPISEPPQKAKPEKPKPPRISSIPEIDADLEPGRVHRFILTAAQDDTPVFKPFLDNLLAYADYLGAQIAVAGFTYQKGLFEDHAAASAIFAPEIRDYLVHDRVRVTPSLLFVADANVLPTSPKPLSGWETVNRGQHVVVPAARIALKSIPRPISDPARYAVSTGCCTLPSYAPRTAGRKAISRHTYGALLVEVDTDGEVFFRHLVAYKDGTFQDLDAFVAHGQVFRGCSVATVVWGDIHHEQLDPVIAMACFGYCTTRKQVVTKDSIYEYLKPTYAFYHDTLDFRRRNHHNVDDPHLMAEVYISGKESVEDEVVDAANFINEMRRDWCTSVMVESNHDSAISRWSKDKRGQQDAANSYYWHELNAAWHRAIRARQDDFNIVEWAMRSAGLAEDVVFLPSGTSYVIRDCQYGFHGDYGVGGAKGSTSAFTQIGRPSTKDHTHAPEIEGDSHTAGLSSKQNQGYNRKGFTRWGFGLGVGYDNGTRVMLLQVADGRYRAIGDLAENRLAA